MKKTSIKTIITICFAGILIISSITTLLVMQGMVKNYFRRQVYDDMKVIVEQVANNIDMELKIVESSVVELSNNALLIDRYSLWSEKAEFFNKRAEELGFKTFFYTDLTGVATNLTPEAEKFNIVQSEFFQQAMQGKVYISEITNDMKDGERVIIVTVPYYRYG